MTFTISQQKTSENLYIIPNGDLGSCTDFSVFGATPNYACVDDPINSPDDDLTYVHHDSDGYDLYTLPNQTITGNINYVTVYVRAKTQDVLMNPNDTFAIICSPASICTDIYESGNIPLTTEYKTYSFTWLKNPKTSANWSWTDINNLSMGAKIESTNGDGNKNEILFPNGNGTSTQWFKKGCVAPSNNYLEVDDNPIDYDSTYLIAQSGCGGSGCLDLYNLPDTGIPIGATITNVTVYGVFRNIYGSSNACKIKLAVRTHATNYYSAEYTINHTDWRTYSNSYATNPNTGSAWTLAEINALEGGMNEVFNVTYGYIQCTQIYVQVDYIEVSNTEFRITQCYCRVNYLPSADSVDLNTPESFEYGHLRNVEELTFWDESRSTYDLNRNSKYLILNGYYVKDELFTRYDYFYFDGYDVGIAWNNNPEKMVNGDCEDSAWTSTDNDEQLCNSNNAIDNTYGIKSVAVRLNIRCSGNFTGDIIFTPIFTGGNGDQHTIDIISNTKYYTSWIDITNDINAPDDWSFTDLDVLDCNVKYIKNTSNSGNIYCIEIRVEYEPPIYDDLIALYNLYTSKETVTISDLNPDCLNGEYRIKDFRYKIIQKNPYYYEWSLLLESAIK
jgi:hypothetical protein